MPENPQFSEEEKKMILKNTDKYRKQLEEIEQEEKKNTTRSNQNTAEESVDPSSLLGPQKKTTVQKITDKQYNIDEEQKRLKRKKTKQRLGYRRLYLFEKIKLSTIVIMLIFIVGCLGLVFRFWTMDMHRYSSRIQDTQSSLVCEDIQTTTQVLNTEGPLEVRIRVKNNSGKPIRLNPNRLILKDNSNASFTLHGSADDVTQIIEDGKTGMITMSYNTKTDSNYYIEATLETENLDAQCVQSIQIGRDKNA